MKKDSADNEPPLRRCAQCDSPAAPGEKLVRCAVCKQICFCDRQCQQAHWSSHKAPCLQSRNKKADALEQKKPSSGAKGAKGRPLQRAAPRKTRPTDCLVAQPDGGAAAMNKEGSASSPPLRCAQCNSQAASGEKLVQCAACKRASAQAVPENPLACCPPGRVPAVPQCTAS